TAYCYADANPTTRYRSALPLRSLPARTLIPRRHSPEASDPVAPIAVSWTATAGAQWWTRGAWLQRPMSVTSLASLSLAQTRARETLPSRKAPKLLSGTEPVKARAACGQQPRRPAHAYGWFDAVDGYGVLPRARDAG